MELKVVAGRPHDEDGRVEPARRKRERVVWRAITPSINRYVGCAVTKMTQATDCRSHAERASLRGSMHRGLGSFISASAWLSPDLPTLSLGIYRNLTNLNVAFGKSE